MTCDKSQNSDSISLQEATALYNSIDLELLKETKIAQTDARELVKQIEKPVSVLPKKEPALKALDAMNNKDFAKMLLYSFIPDGAPALEQLPTVAQKREEHNSLIDFVADNTKVDRGYLQKHLRNVLVKGYGKSPENLLHDVATGKDKDVNELKGLGWVTAAISAASTLATLFQGTPEDRSDTGYQQFLATVNRGNIFPSYDELVAALQTRPDVIRDRTWGDALSSPANYDESTGTFARGDWRQAVTSLTPIVIKSFKGAGESFEVRTTYNSQALERAYARKTAPATQDWRGLKVSPNQNITNDPGYIPAKSKDNTAWWLLGGVAVLGVGSYALLSD